MEQIEEFNNMQDKQLDIVHCAGCRQPITRNASRQIINNKYYHEGCLPTIDNDTPIDTRPICYECSKPINHNEEVTINKNVFHTSCVTGEELLDSQHKPGAKLDQGKNRLGLVLGGFSLALQEVGKVGTFGADKYSDNGWKEVPEGINRYTDAMLRHHMSEQAGEEYDDETKLLHAAAVAWNALARLDLIISEQELNNENN